MQTAPANWIYIDTGEVLNEAAELVASLPAPDDEIGELLAAAPKLKAALIEAVRYLEYLAGDAAGTFVGPGMPREALAQARTALAAVTTTTGA